MIKSKKHSFIICSLLILGLLSAFISNVNINVIALNLDFNIRSSMDNTSFEGWKWTHAEVVSTESTEISWMPIVEVDSTGSVHVIWTDYTDYLGSGIDQDVFYKKWESGSGWTTTEVVSTESTGNSLNPDLFIDSSNTIHVVWSDNTNYLGSGIDNDVLYKKHIEGMGWTAAEVVSTESTFDSITPSVAVDSSGVIHVVWKDDTENYEGSGIDPDIFYKQREDLGWLLTEVVSTESTGISYYPTLALDSSNNVHIAWADQTDYLGSGTDNDIFYKQRIDGSGWTVTEFISTESAAGSIVPSIAIDSSDTIHLAWRDGSDYLGCGIDDDIFYKKMIGDSIWTTTEVISTESTHQSYQVSLAIDSTDAVHVVWRDETGADSDYDIFYKNRDYYRDSWTDVKIISTESTDDAVAPSISIGPKDGIHIVWYDYTDYDGTDLDIIYRKFAGPPEAPELAFLLPNPTELNTVYLHWNIPLGSANHYIYRSSEYIWSVDLLTPITDTSSDEYIDTLPTEGIYYYVIVAENDLGNSTISNCLYIEYTIPTLSEILIPVGIILGFISIPMVLALHKKRKNNP